jgi:ribosomal-protein-alanine N-acetyltransferase
MTPADMAAIHAACFTMPRPWSAAEIAGLLDSPFSFAIKAQGGFLLGRVVAGEAELLTVAVDPAARRQGIGTGLVRAFLDEAAARGGESIFLEVAEFNTAARAVYARAGFVETARRRGYYHAPDGRSVDAVIMARAISPRLQG